MLLSCPSNRGFYLLLSMLAAFSAPSSLSAWEDHDQLTALALADEAFASATVTAEPLEVFLEA